MAESYAFNTGIDISTYGQEEVNVEGTASDNITPQTNVSNVRPSISPAIDEEVMEISIASDSIQNIVKGFILDKGIEVKRIDIPVINDTRGRYYDHFLEVSQELKTSILSQEALGFSAKIVNPNLEVFSYRGRVFYFSTKDVISRINLEEIKRVISEGGLYELNIYSMGEFSYDPIELAKVSQAFSGIKSDIVEEGEFPSSTISIRLGLV